MAIKDKIKWNKKYQDYPLLLEHREPSKKLILALTKTKGNKALDIACGAGKNTIYLAKKDFFIEALDISEVALDSLSQKSFKNVKTKIIDLENYTPNENNYDLIVKTNYLDRNIIPNLAKGLKRDGILFIETYMEHPSNEKENSNPDFLLKKEELKTFFDQNYEILDYDEFDNEVNELYKMKKQSIIVKRR